MESRFSKTTGCASLVLLVATACHRPPPSDIPGTYSVKYSFGAEILTIKPNGDYTQVITVDSDQVQITRNGTWVYEQTNGEITLREHIMAHDGYGGLNPKLRDPNNRWNAVLSVKKDLVNHVVIIASADGAGFDYRKVK